VNEDILGGIEVAVAKGEPIESVMMGFYSSGYPKEDIEWAAKAFQMNGLRPGQQVVRKNKNHRFFQGLKNRLPNNIHKKAYAYKAKCLCL